MADENNKFVTITHLKKSLERVKAENDSGVETATDAEIDAMLNEVFGTGDNTDDSAEDGGEEA